jgi:hypothetical protein
VAVEVNSPDASEVDPPAELDPRVEAVRALGAAREGEEAAVDEDELRANACSGPNSRLARSANVNASVDVAGRRDPTPSGRPAPGTASW